MQFEAQTTEPPENPPQAKKTLWEQPSIYHERYGKGTNAENVTPYTHRTGSSHDSQDSIFNIFTCGKGDKIPFDGDEFDLENLACSNLDTWY